MTCDVKAHVLNNTFFTLHHSNTSNHCLDLFLMRLICIFLTVLFSLDYYLFDPLVAYENYEHVTPCAFARTRV